MVKLKRRGKWLLRRYLIPPGFGDIVGGIRVFPLDGIVYPETIIQKMVAEVDAFFYNFWHLWLQPLIRKKLRKHDT